MICGCTEARACPGGCAWVESHPATATGVCSGCLEEAVLSLFYAAERAGMRWSVLPHTVYLGDIR